MSRPLKALRAALHAHDLDGFIVPHADAFQNEFLPPHAERLAWVSGFTGSAGVAFVLADRAALFVDGRYTLQARSEVNETDFALHHMTSESPYRWVADTLSVGARLGYDPWLHTVHEVEHWRAACQKAGGVLVAVETNPLDAVWQERPSPVYTPIVAHDLTYAGQAADEKITDVSALLRDEGFHACLLTSPDSVAWLFNIRGNDVPHTPLPLAFAVVTADGSAILFADPCQFSPALSAHLPPSVSLHPFGDLVGTLERQAGMRVRLDPATCPEHLFSCLHRAGGQVHTATDPCSLAKACKNPVEIAGARAAHRRDGAVLCRFLHWLDAHAPQGKISEIQAREKLDSLREADSLFRQPSFDTISASGPNGAVVHYRAAPATNRYLRPGDIYLTDSGGQYLDGTTDVTRTVFIAGTSPDAGPFPDECVCRHFTHVLKAHMTLATAHFPEGTTGAELDVLPRASLWKVGLAYDHGTGHGVGSYLNVHEGPQRIARRGGQQDVRPNMIVSNEPGFYQTGSYGIRIENLQRVCPPDTGNTEGGLPMLSFEALTLAPFDRRLIDMALLSDEEKAWVDLYHKQVREALMPLLDAATGHWLAAATRPLGET